MGSFSFKQFHIEQDQCAMKVGTDGVLLGAWAGVEESDYSILDIGTGTGLIALMMAQRAPKAKIIGVEIDNQCAIQARENCEASKWSERVSIVNSAIQDYSPREKFDLILSNPPYFVDSLLSPDVKRSVARHTTTLSFEELARDVARLLNNTGRFCVILPREESLRFDTAANGLLHLWQRTSVRGKDGGDVKRVMSEYRLSSCEKVTCDEFAVRAAKGGDYTDQYRSLTADFYLKF